MSQPPSPHILPMRLLPLRLQAYRQALLVTPPDDDSLQARAQLWCTTEQNINTLLQLHPTTPDQEAETVLTLLVLLQVSIRNYAPLTTAIDRAYTILPHITAPKLRAHLLTLLYQETEDEDLLPDIDHLLSTWTEATMTEEDHYLLQLHQTQSQPDSLV
ncbi:MAG: hypothetical protein IJR02_11960 [Bacteroidaceae bacterium]|nr:hypothetical protein [Bacteroidaceae bacterium]